MSRILVMAIKMYQFVWYPIFNGMNDRGVVAVERYAYSGQRIVGIVFT